MVSLKVAAEAKAKVQGSDEIEKHPIVAKVLGSGKDGSLNIQLGSDSQLLTRVEADVLSPITITSPELQKMVDSIARIADNFRIVIKSDEKNPIAIALGKIPVDMKIEVFSPAEDSVFRIDIKGSIGEQ